MGIVKAIWAFFSAIGSALGLANRGLDRKAGVDSQRALNAEATLKKQQEVDHAPEQLATPERDARDADPRGWLRSRPGDP